MLSFKDFIGLLEEDAPANATGAMVSTDVPIKSLGMGRRKSQTFDVPIEVFNNFAKGKKKWKKWSDYLNLQDDAERSIYDYAKKNPRGIIILKNGDKIKAIRYNRHGSGCWHKIARAPRT